MTPILSRPPLGALALVLAALVALPAMAQTPPPVAPPTPPVTGAAATAPAAAAAAPALAAFPLPAPRQSWMSDRRTFQVGDIVTVMIDDYTITTAIKENTASDTRTRNLGLTARLPSGASKGGGLDTRNDASQDTRGSSRRENRFQNEMSVRVVATGADGLLQVKGTKSIDVDKSMQDITLTGWIRAQDISSQNMVESARVADAKIGYTSPGSLTKPKQGIVSKILGAFWP